MSDTLSENVDQKDEGFGSRGNNVCRFKGKQPFSWAVEKVEPPLFMPQARELAQPARETRKGLVQWQP